MPKFSINWLNGEQDDAVRATPHHPTFIVAGPGTGKTTVLALRALKLILVDGIPPTGILATTFTRKAADELRSRILAWGYAAIMQARAVFSGDATLSAWLQDIDINGVRVGTLDSLAEQFLAECRPVGGITPATIEGFFASALMRRFGFFAHGRQSDPNFEAFLASFVPPYPGPRPFYVKLGVALMFSDRVRHDQIDLAAFAGTGAGQQTLEAIVNDYFAYLQANHYADFGRLESLLLQRVQQNQLQRITQNLRAVLVDEFQDTNYLQEQIYLAICQSTSASLTVVGDDDQSIFRFRGATVEIFANFENRITSALGSAWQPQRVDLFRNYRSASPIVDFCNRFIQLDPGFQPARAPGKFGLVASAEHAQTSHPPVLGMFRTDCPTLAADLSQFLHGVFRGGGFTVHCADGNHRIVRGPTGDFGDAVLLSQSVREFAQGDPPRIRLPLHLRNILRQNFQVPVFNPRGRSLSDIPFVQLLLGLALECIDPGGGVQQSIAGMPVSSRNRMTSWRAVATTFAHSNPPPGGLQAFLQSWATRTLPPNSSMPTWPSEWPLLELLFTLLTWIPDLQHSPEGQVYLEAIARTVSEAGQFAPYGSRILHGAGVHDQRSVRVPIREVFENIANGDVEVDEEIMPYVPRNYFPIMTVHQAKGLEFPLVIVDVGSDFSRNHPQQRRARFPESPDQVHVIEDMISPFCPIGQARSQRPSVDRAWDDLRRLYLVAFSRPENVLLMVGLTSQMGAARVKSVATGDIRNAPRALTFVPSIQWHSGMGADHVALI